MPKDALWRVNQQSVIGHGLVAEGSENVIYNPPEGGEVGENLSPMNAEAQAIVDGQKSPHPDKTKVKPEPAPAPKPKAAKVAKDAVEPAKEPVAAPAEPETKPDDDDIG